MKKKNNEEREIVNKTQLITEINNPFYQKLWFWILIVLVIALVLFGIGWNSQVFNGETSSIDSSEINTTQSSSKKIPTKKEEALEKAKEYVKDEPSRIRLANRLLYTSTNFNHDDVQYAIDHLDVNWNEMALKVIDIYQKDFFDPNKNSQDLHFLSKKQLYADLTNKNTENFKPKEAEYALDHVDIDWKDMALKVAQKKYASDGYSKVRLFNTLSSPYVDYFTEEETQYAVDHVNFDWNKHALQATERYIYDNYSKEGLLQQLQSKEEGFTKDQAQYAVDHVNIDWNTNALEQAKYFQSLGLSKDKILDKLTSKDLKFTQEQGNYAINKLTE